MLVWGGSEGVLKAGLWLCVVAAMEIRADVKTVGALLEQFYSKRRLLILSAPNISDLDYQLQNIMIQVRRLFASEFLWKFFNQQVNLNVSLSSPPEIRMWVGPATCHRDRAPGLPASRDGPH